MKRAFKFYRQILILITVTVIMSLTACSAEGVIKKDNAVDFGNERYQDVSTPDDSNNKDQDVSTPDDLKNKDKDVSMPDDLSNDGRDESSQDETNIDIQGSVIEVVHEDDDVSGLTGALAFVRKLRLGWNLGNTLDATNSSAPGANLGLETAWCGTRTTPEMIDALKEAGFKAVRIPVSWHNHVDKDYNIYPEWLERVKEIVDYVIERDMYCTINIHHDNMKEYIYPTSEYLEQSKRYVGKIWEQVGETFKDYDDHLIFESLNEPRMVGTANEWYLSNNDACKDAVKCINELNQLFVDIVRAQGGKNAERYLLVPGYAGQWGAAASDDFVIPTDTADNKILIEVHAYSPENFALTAPTESSSTDTFDETSGKSVGGINSMVARLKEKFISKGIGVVIDEFGSRDKSGNTEEREKHAAYYVKKAREAGITCYLWDNHVFFGSGERFGLLDRKTCQIRYPGIMQALFDNCQ